MTELLDPASAPPETAPIPPTADGGFPPLAEPPVLEGGWAWLEPYVRPSFIKLNRYCMLPMLRAGLGAWMGTPIGGYILMLRVRGRKSGLAREIALSYYMAEGSVWVLAGFGRRTEWYRNLLVDPHVDVWLPGRRFAAIAEEIPDPVVRTRVMPEIVRATGLPGFMIGLNPWTAGDEAVMRALDWIPLIRITPDPGPIEAGADDPGGRAWIWRQGLVLGLSVLAWRVVRRLIRPR